MAGNWDLSLWLIKVLMLMLILSIFYPYSLSGKYQDKEMS